MFSSTTFRRVATLLALTPLCFSALGSTEECFFDPLRPEYAEPPDGMRSNIFSNPVAACPSVGGVVMANPGPIEMQHLNLPRTHDTSRSGGDDDMAVLVLQLGARWWPDWGTYARHKTAIDDGVEYRHHFPPRLEVAYPSSGGVWVAEYSPDMPQVRLLEEEERREGRDTLPPVPGDWWNKMNLVLTMDERASALRRFGATFYERPEDCPDLALSVKRAKDMFEPYKELLERMDNLEYRNKWYSELHGLPEDDAGKFTESRRLLESWGL